VISSVELLIANTATKRSHLNGDFLSQWLHLMDLIPVTDALQKRDKSVVSARRHIGICHKISAATRM
jgi:hypothetical protein